MNRSVFFALALSFASASCGPNGADTHAGEQSILATDHAYRVWYLSPLWTVVSMSTDHAVIHINAPSNPHLIESIRGSITELTIDVLASSADTVVGGYRGLAAMAPDALIYPSRPVMLAGGVMGSELAYGGVNHIMRVVTATLHDGRTLVLAFESVNAIGDDPDVTQMINEVETTGLNP